MKEQLITSMQKVSDLISEEELTEDKILAFKCMWIEKFADELYAKTINILDVKELTFALRVEIIALYLKYNRYLIKIDGSDIL